MTAPKPPEDHLPKGRPSKFTEELASLICAEIRAGSNVSKVAAKGQLKSEDGTVFELPSEKTIYTWMHVHPDFLQNIRSARQIKAFASEAEAERIREAMEGGEIQPQEASVHLTQLRWQMMKESEKDFGAKKKVEHSGEIKGGYSAMSTDELAAEIERRQRDLSTSEGDESN